MYFTYFKKIKNFHTTIISFTKFNKFSSQIYSNIPQSKQLHFLFKSLQIHSLKSLLQSKHTLKLVFIDSKYLFF